MSPSTGTNARGVAKPAQMPSGGGVIEMGKRLRQEAGDFPWKDALLRMAADVVLVEIHEPQRAVHDLPMRIGVTDLYQDGLHRDSHKSGDGDHRH